MSHLFDEATEGLYEVLRIHALQNGNLSLRTLLQEHNGITIDILAGANKFEIDRFSIEYSPDTVGNRTQDGVNLKDMRYPNTITANAGTLGCPRLLANFSSTDELIRWLDEITSKNS
mgnify:CR=1 FL=1|tara:strand:- start:1216 stop:1566 length:351 start_codon:yes stop_codon:yes gene_type:complete